MTSVLLFVQCVAVFTFGSAIDDEMGRRVLQSAKMHRELLDTGTVLLTTTTSIGGGTYQETWRCDFDGPKSRMAYLTGPRMRPAAYGGHSPNVGEPWFIDVWDGGQLVTRQFVGKEGERDYWRFLINDWDNKNITSFFYAPALGLLPYHGMNAVDINKAAGLNGTVTGSRAIEGTRQTEVTVEFPHPTYGAQCLIKLIVDGAKGDNVVHYEYRVTPSHGRWEGYKGDVELKQFGQRWFPKKVVHHSLVDNGIETVTMMIEVTEANFGVSFPGDYFTLAGLGYQEGDFMVDVGNLPNP